MWRTCCYRLSRTRYQACKAYGSDLPDHKLPAALRHQNQGEGGEFWRQLEALEQPKLGLQVFNRWDWHAGQLLVALLPAAAIYAIAMWARKDMARAEKELLEKDANPEAAGTQSLRSFTASMQRKEKATQHKEYVTEARLDALEQLVKELQTELRAQHTRQQHSEQKSRAQPTDSG
ncbi:hypothetical protein WJX74_006580 [Apatococcus lobatus]|uniref:Uncharacterized protein n=1 Tax=Apatococcus lobatus TaxID=904363 RepID=A0AAW1S6U7_9CHLO